jgi:glutamate formiminotransferase/formiminotetrahydrofolate cyclodeaminase
MKIIECVPNISEGRDKKVLDAVAAAVESVAGVRLLDVDPGRDTHRTVFTFVGEPSAVSEAAYQLIETALSLIDMRQHHGAHARLGAVDVVPFVPVGGGASMDDCVELARQLGARVGEQLKLPVYLYERAATRPERRSLAEIRQGEYEGLAAKLSDPGWLPDYGPAQFVPRSGAIVIGARPFLIAYNIDINSDDRQIAHDIALELREQGRLQRGPDGQPLRDAAGQAIKKSGRLAAVRAVGWHIPEFQRAQISMNLLDYHVTPPHLAFEATREEARQRGVRVTGSELVGLIPREALLAAGRYYLTQQGKTSAVPEPDLIASARLSLGLDDVKPFDPQKAVIEYRLAPRPSGLAALSCTQFCDELSRATPTPGGGSVSALAGALAASLTSMVSALTHASSKTSAQSKTSLVELGSLAESLKERLLLAIDRDSAAYDGIVAARRLPKKTEQQAQQRQAALHAATRTAIDVPLEVVELAASLAQQIERATALGMSSAASDLGVAAWCCRSAAEGAALNVRINLADLSDTAQVTDYNQRLQQALASARSASDRALAEVEKLLHS